MIPYFAQPELKIGPISIHLFGVLVACAVIVGVKILIRRAERMGLADHDASKFVNWILVGGFAGAHLVDRFVYFPQETMADPATILKFWSGLSSFGGFLGGTLCGLLYFNQRAKPGTAWKYVESFSYAFPFGWIFGRLGCTVAYDHPGAPTSFFLGQVYRDGVVRFNLGLIEALYSVVIAAVFYVLGRKPRFSGFFLGMFLVLYAPVRFAIDFLRIVDVRYAGLTPGQWGSLALLAGGSAILWTRRGQPAPEKSAA